MFTQGNRSWRSLMAMMVLLGFGLLATGQAQAACAAVPTDGLWTNINPDTRSITKVWIGTTCIDMRTPGDDDVVPPPGMGRIQLWGACSPTDCEWQTVPYYQAYFNWNAAFIDHGFAHRKIFFRIYPPNWGMNRSNETRLRLVVQTTFTDGRPNYTTEDWFRLKTPTHPMPPRP